jgi:predicted DNA-binding transcriptional regulator AlpA
MADDIPVFVKRPKAHRGAGFSDSTAWRLARSDPSFPQAIQLGPNSWAYRLDEWNAWLASRPRKPRAGAT